MAMAVDSLKVIFLIAELDYAVKSGGLAAPERSALAKRFGVSEEVLLRYEHAKCAYDSLSEKQWRQAMVEASRQMPELRGEFNKDKYLAEFEAALSRIEDAAPENEITRELRAALAALRAAVDGPTSTPPADGDQ